MALREGKYQVTHKAQGKWCLIQNGQEINGTYVPFQEVQERHPNGVYTIVGEVLLDVDVSAEQVLFVETDEGNSLPVNPVGVYSNQSYKNVGYIPCGENRYIGLYQKKRTAAHVWMLLAAVVLLLALVLAGVWALNRYQAQKHPTIGGYEIETSIADYEGTLTRPADMDQTQILIPGFSALRFKAGSDEVKTMLFNPKDNPCFFQFNVVDGTTGEVIYESKLVPPGKGIEQIQLNRTYEAGVYPAVIQFNTHDLEEPSIRYNGSEMKITLVVVE